MKTRFRNLCVELGFSYHKLEDGILLLNYLNKTKEPIEVQKIAVEYGGDVLRIYPLLFDLSRSGAIKVTDRGQLGEIRKCKINLKYFNSIPLVAAFVELVP
ncbi:hypothetical protein BN938_2245 [Mucinivorans hirudinis]|uniref:Uncharacterized protein n=1 Tax=Mucinivorans hirudinis TaxID=1433126 RepID=A0A060R9Q0_9BACT|nr:hypothetical protein BN938_2245 [Mucinivorans hirudinis]